MTLLELQNILGERIRIAIDPDMSVEERKKETDPETGPFSEWLAEYLVDHLPTLTPPNEPLTCEGCVAVGTGYGPCMNCIRSKPRRDLYRRPPEGEA